MHTKHLKVVGPQKTSSIGEGQSQQTITSHNTKLFSLIMLNAYTVAALKNEGFPFSREPNSNWVENTTRFVSVRNFSKRHDLHAFVYLLIITSCSCAVSQSSLKMGPLYNIFLIKSVTSKVRMICLKRCQHCIKRNWELSP